MKLIDTDYFVVGTGIAGLMSAIHLSRHGRVLIATKKDSADSNTNYAQGGIACVVASSDSFEDHIRDTLTAGAGLCDENVVREIISGGPDRITELEKLGMQFSEREGYSGSEYDLGKEGGHSHRRVLHVGDMTGRRVEEVLLERVRNNPAISVRENCFVIDLVTTGWLRSKGPNRCVGAYVLDRHSGEIAAVRSACVILATGGGGKVYLYTSNPDIATGDGVAVAWRAGVPIKNMEFIQFHPTCLFHPRAKSFLISETVRGEGGRLVDGSGKPFMEKYDTRKELAPRDVVARAIDREMKVRGAACMYLDIRQRSGEFLEKRFPTIYRKCKSLGIDMASDLVPVVPAAHYFCGGIEAGLDGRTKLPGLLACGEAACTGLHGANRLASNSLLEALVCSHRMASSPEISSPSRPGVEIPPWRYGDAVPSDEEVVIRHNWNEVRTCMWDYVGIVRSTKRQERAMRRIRNLRAEIREYYLDYLVTPDILELRNIAAVGELIVRSALARKESRGLHYTLDYPQTLEKAAATVIEDEPGGHPEK
ncbi:MAG: L-aspartate oxidase [Kiritimatiellia bacterium]